MGDAAALAPGRTPDIVGREAERSRIDAFIAAFRGGVWALGIRGEPGIGKTSLLRYAVARCRLAELAVLITRPAEEEMPLALVGIVDLFEHVELDAAALPRQAIRSRADARSSRRFGAYRETGRCSWPPTTRNGSTRSPPAAGPPRAGESRWPRAGASPSLGGMSSAALVVAQTAAATAQESPSILGRPTRPARHGDSGKPDGRPGQLSRGETARTASSWPPARVASCGGNKASSNADDGILVAAATAQTDVKRTVTRSNGDDGFDVDSASTALRRNTSENNVDWGFETVAGIVDAGLNAATGNGTANCDATHLAC